MSVDRADVEGVDLHALPFTEAASVLRKWALAEIAELLPSDRDRPPAFDRSELEKFRRFLGAHGRVTPPPVSSPWFALHSPTLPLLARLIVASARPPRILEAVKERLVGRRRIRRHAYVPSSAWALVGTIAWSDPVFAYQVSQQVRAYLRPQLLFGPGPFPALSIDPRTFWFLLAMAKLARKGWWRTPLRLQYVCLRCARRLTTEAERLATEGKWAGFWDQWILAEAEAARAAASRGSSRFSRLRRRFFPKVPTKLQQMIAALPVHRRFSPTETSRPAARSPAISAGSIAAPDWARTMPEWMTQPLISPTLAPQHADGAP